MKTLDSLTDDQLATVYDWLLDLPTKQVVEKVALPVPEGFGIKTHVTTLRRFKEKRWAELAADRIQAATQLAGITANQPSQLETLDTGIQVAIKHHMFQRVSSPNITDDQLAIVSRWSHRQEKLKLEIQRVQIARERCAQNNLRLQLLTSRRLNPPPFALGKPNLTPNLNLATPSRGGANVPVSPNIAADHVSCDANVSKTGIQFVAGSGSQTADPSSDTALSSPSENSALSTQHSALRECDHLGPLARNWEDVRRRAQIKFGITPEESARRAELRRTWKNPNNNNNGGTRSPSPTSTSRDAITPNNAVSAGREIQDASHAPLNLFTLLKEITDSVKAAGGHLPPPPPEPETTASSPNQPSLATQVVQAPQST